MDQNTKSSGKVNVGGAEREIDHRGRLTVYDKCDGAKRTMYPIDAAQAFAAGHISFEPIPKKAAAAQAASGDAGAAGGESDPKKAGKGGKGDAGAAGG